MLENESFVTRYKRSLADFTRNRVLTFQTITVLLMAKGMKSLQLSLNEFIPKVGLAEQTVSKVAYSKARRKLKHGAFIALNQEAVVRTMYEDGNYQTYRGLRILGVDGSKVLLPNTSGTVKAFGVNTHWNRSLSAIGEHCFGLASVMYDVLNHIAIDAQLEPCSAYEVDVAAKHLKNTQGTDLTIYDRGYCSFRMMALVDQARGFFLIRCPSARFTVARDMFAGKGPDDVIVSITASRSFLVNPKNQGLPTILTVRFVRAVLDNGTIEVLATSLLDPEMYLTSIFKELYYLRWGVETFYGILKTRLGIENFSGYSPEAIRQDFYATILLTGIESIFTADAEAELSKQHGGTPKKVNKAVSFNAIKYRAFELFYSKAPRKEVLKQLDELFMTSPTLVRKGRKPPRENVSSHHILQFWKRQRKAVF